MSWLSYMSHGWTFSLQFSMEPKARVPQARSSDCKSSVVETAECSWHHAVRVVPAWCDHGVACQWSIMRWRSAQTATCAVEVSGKPYMYIAANNSTIIQPTGYKRRSYGSNCSFRRHHLDDRVFRAPVWAVYRSAYVCVCVFYMFFLMFVCLSV